MQPAQMVEVVLPMRALWRTLFVHLHVLPKQALKQTECVAECQKNAARTRCHTMGNRLLGVSQIQHHRLPNSDLAVEPVRNRSFRLRRTIPPSLQLFLLSKSPYFLGFPCPLA